MTEVKNRLFDAFRDDHARFGHSLHALGERLRAGDGPGIRQAAEQLDGEAGAHIAFEQEDFYPALAPFLSKSEIQEMYDEHADGCDLLVHLQRLSDEELANEEKRDALLKRVHDMEHHISECGELFGAMGGLDDAAQRQLLEQLEEWRQRAPRWSEIDMPAKQPDT